MADLVVLDFDGTETADASSRSQGAPQGAPHRPSRRRRRHPSGGRRHPDQAIGQLDRAWREPGDDTGALLGGSCRPARPEPISRDSRSAAPPGAAMGALGGKMSDFGINDGFIKELARRSSRVLLRCSCCREGHDGQGGGRDQGAQSDGCSGRRSHRNRKRRIAGGTRGRGARPRARGVTSKLSSGTHFSRITRLHLIRRRRNVLKMETS
jgi:hypothetical protein